MKNIFVTEFDKHKETIDQQLHTFKAEVNTSLELQKEDFTNRLKDQDTRLDALEQAPNQVHTSPESSQYELDKLFALEKSLIAAGDKGSVLISNCFEASRFRTTYG